MGGGGGGGGNSKVIVSFGLSESSNKSPEPPLYSPAISEHMSAFMSFKFPASGQYDAILLSSVTTTTTIHARAAKIVITIIIIIIIIIIIAFIYTRWRYCSMITDVVVSFEKITINHKS